MGINVANNRQYEFAYTFIMTNIDHILLENLAAEPNHGYGLIAKIKKEHKVLLGSSTVYPSLHELEKKGLIQHFWDMEAPRPKRVYIVTDKGLETVRHQRMTLTQILSKLGMV